jgi:hypothetical protein
MSPSVKCARRHRRLDRRALADHEHVAGEAGDVVLGHEVAERVEQLRDVDFGAAHHLAPGRRIELDEPPIARRVDDGEAGRDAVALALGHLPLARRRPVAGVRSSATSSVDKGGPPMIRLVNQLESGTSSIVLMLMARRFMFGSPGLPNRLRASS